jgi:hypothetical protein
MTPEEVREASTMCKELNAQICSFTHTARQAKMDQCRLLADVLYIVGQSLGDDLGKYMNSNGYSDTINIFQSFCRDHGKAQKEAGE